MLRLSKKRKTRVKKTRGRNTRVKKTRGGSNELNKQKYLGISEIQILKALIKEIENFIENNEIEKAKETIKMTENVLNAMLSQDN